MRKKPNAGDVWSRGLVRELANSNACVDAACESAILAREQTIRELRERHSDEVARAREEERIREENRWCEDL